MASRTALPPRTSDGRPLPTRELHRLELRKPTRAAKTAFALSQDRRPQLFARLIGQETDGAVIIAGEAGSYYRCDFVGAPPAEELTPVYGPVAPGTIVFDIAERDDD